MLVSQKLAIAAHLHVLLRRKTGRVTETEWMAGNLDYALEIVRFAREGQHERTPLQSAISALVAWHVGIALLVCVVLAATRLSPSGSLPNAPPDSKGACRPVFCSWLFRVFA